MRASLLSYRKLDGKPSYTIKLSRSFKGIIVMANYWKSRQKSTGIQIRGWMRPARVMLNSMSTPHYPNDLNGVVSVVLWDDKGGFIPASSDILEHVADAAMA